MRAATHRRAIPLGVKLHAMLLALGYTDDEIVNGGIEWDHCPALALRFVDPETGLLTPAANDPRYIRPMRKAAHRIKTSGTRATTAGSDIHAVSKVKRLASEEEAFRRRVLAKAPTSAPKRKKARIASRPFPRRPRETSEAAE